MKTNILLIAAFFGTAMLFVGCNPSQTKDASTLAQRGSDTTNELSDFYGSLASDCRKEPQLLELSLDQPLAATDPDIDKYQGLSDEFAKRQKACQALKGVYDALGDLAAGKPTDLDKSLSNLQTAIVKLNGNHALNIGVNGQNIPSDVVKTAENKIAAFVIDLRKQPDLRSANSDLEGIATELDVVFQDEGTSYKAIAEGNVHESYQFARNMARGGNGTGADTFQLYVQSTGLKVLPNPMTGNVLANWISNSKAQEKTAIIEVDEHLKSLKASLTNLKVYHDEFGSHKKIEIPAPQ